jgi:protein-glutamine gamma-glutamyltransferase
MAASHETRDFTLAEAIRRYFDVALYLLIFTGFGTLASTGHLDFPTVLIVTASLLFRGYMLSRRRRVLLSERWTNLLTIGCVGFYISDQFVISRAFLSATVHLALFVMLVRLFSAQRDRDHYLLAALAFVMVLAAAVLTVDSTFLFALGGFILVATATLILMEMMHSSQKLTVQARDPRMPRAYRRLSYTIAAIAPLLLVFIFIGAAFIFFLLPRVSAGYMSAYSVANDLTTGFSDRVELGRIGQIQRSKQVVMHVQIEGATPPGFTLKLRGIVLNSFDGRIWTNTRSRLPLKRAADGRFNVETEVPPPAPLGMVHYRVTMEPLVSDVFFLLATPRSLRGNYRIVSGDGAGDAFDMDAEHPVTRYEADSTVEYPSPRHVGGRISDYAPGIQSTYLQLPPLDPRIPALAQEITAKAQSPLEKAAAIEHYLRVHYGYTLEMSAALPRDPIADFLFVRRRGHCEYFASAMALMLRSLGIPARVVNGFAGGEFNDISAQYVVRASDAHSWVETYIPGNSWVEFDPTPSSDGQLYDGWNRFLLYVDAMASFWREWVINYDLAHQLRLTQEASQGSREIVGSVQSWAHARYRRLLQWARHTEDKAGRSTLGWGLQAWWLCLVVLFALALPRLFARLRRFRLARRPDESPEAAATIWYQRMLRQAARRGWKKAPEQTPAEFASKITDQRLQGHIMAFSKHYENARFGGDRDEASRLPEIYEEIKTSR